jgi:hypothetical protein
MLEIKLNGLNGIGKYAIVSPEDYPMVARHSWYYREGYALAKIDSKEIRMHRYIMDVHDPDLIECFGESKTIADWSRDPRCEVNYDVLRSRIYKGVEPWAAILAPVE